MNQQYLFLPLGYSDGLFDASHFLRLVLLPETPEKAAQGKEQSLSTGSSCELQTWF
jgi:hypothetical protein